MLSRQSKSCTKHMVLFRATFTNMLPVEYVPVIIAGPYNGQGVC